MAVPGLIRGSAGHLVLTPRLPAEGEGAARPRAGPVGRLRGAFLDMGAPVDDLQVRRAPEAEEVGPGQIAVPARNLEERDAVVDLGAAQEPPPGRPATASLQALQRRA